MIIKSFTAGSVAAALKTVRKEMGGDAVVLKTRQLTDTDGKGCIEVTACLDKPTVAQAGMALPDMAGRRRTTIAQVSMAGPSEAAPGVPGDAVLSEKLAALDRKVDLLLRNATAGTGEGSHDADGVHNVRLALQDADVPPEFIQFLVARARETRGGGEPLDAAMERVLRLELSKMACSRLEFRHGDRLLFVGPAGSGKTSLLGKLAAHFVVSGKNVRLVTLDGCKVGAFDEIHSYAELLEADVLDSPAPGADVADNGNRILLIDSPAFPHQRQKIADLKAQVDRLDPGYRFITLSALNRSSDILEFARWIEPIEPTHLAVTMLDLTIRWGAVIAGHRATGLPVAFVTDSPSGTGRAMSPDASRIADRLLGREAGRE
ncbi:MAG TPA: hypothetical protein VMY05_11345 [Acidobacteriota bacterium]|nr:hypothetical protein [Acidobacteriota bacterium]